MMERKDGMLQEKVNIFCIEIFCSSHPLLAFLSWAQKIAEHLTGFATILEALHILFSPVNGLQGFREK